MHGMMFAGFGLGGLAGRFAIAFLILWFMLSQNKEDAFLKKSIKWLVVLALIGFAVKIIFSLFFAGIFTRLLGGFHYYF